MSEIRERSSKPSDEGSWVWLARHALEVVTDMANETNQAASVRSVLLAVAQLVRDGSSTVDTTRAVLCALAGVRYTTLDASLKILVRAGIVIVERIRYRGLDTGLRIQLLSVPVKRAPVPAADTDKSEEGLKKEMKRNEQMSASAGAEPVMGFSSKAAKIGTVRNPRPLPASVEEVFEYSQLWGIPLERARAFYAYQVARDWKMRGRVLVDWHSALSAWAKTDHARVLKLDSMTNEEFWAMVDEEGIEHETATAWVGLMQKNKWCLKNPLTGRKEPVRNYRTALKAFVASELNQIFEENGIR